MEGFFNEDVVRAFQDDAGFCALWIRGTVYIKCPLVFLRGVLKVVVKIEQALGFNGAVWFITNVEFREFHDLGRHPTSKVKLLEYTRICWWMSGLWRLGRDVSVVLRFWRTCSHSSF